MKNIISEEQFAESFEKYYKYYNQIENIFKDKECVIMELDRNIDSFKALFDYVFQTGQLFYYNDFINKNSNPVDTRSEHDRLNDFLNDVKYFTICNTIQINAFRFLMSLIADKKNDSIFMDGRFLGYIDPERKHEVKVSSSFTDKNGYHTDIFLIKTNYVDILKECVDSQTDYIKKNHLKKIENCEFRFGPFYNKFYSAVKAKIGNYSRN